VTSSTQSQQAAKLSKSSTENGAPSEPTEKQGDQVTISEQGKQLAKSITLSKAKVAENLQDAMVKEKSLTAKIADAKAEGRDVGGLNAQLADATKAVAKNRAQANQ
jgi:hypothetical protein